MIRQVFGYVDQFKDRIFVIRIDGEIIMDPLFPVLVRDLALLHRVGIRTILVPGAHTRIDQILSKYGLAWDTVDGVRVSSPRAIPFIKMAAFDVSNRVMTLLAENRLNAVIGNWVRARAIGVRDGVDFQETGLVDKLKSDIIRKVLDDGLIPIFPNIGWSAGGRPYNISSGELSATLSRELSAEKLFFISTRKGILASDYELPPGLEPLRDGVVSRMTPGQARELLRMNTSTRGETRVGGDHDPLLTMVALSCDVCDAGVPRVHIVDGRIEGVVLKEVFSSEGQGTMIHADEHSGVRPMRQEDIPAVLRIMQPAVERGMLVRRTAQELGERAADFVVFEVDGLVHGSGALHRYPDGSAEIAALAVDESYVNQRVGRSVLRYLLQQARDQGLSRAFVLTTQTTDWFEEFGFRPGTVEDLPEGRSYDGSRRSRILINDIRSGSPS